MCGVDETEVIPQESHGAIEHERASVTLTAVRQVAQRFVFSQNGLQRYAALRECLAHVAEAREGASHSLRIMLFCHNRLTRKVNAASLLWLLTNCSPEGARRIPG
jgi:hypothetical protein